jgi:hypothetical protein
MTILSNLVQYHPEAAAELAFSGGAPAAPSPAAAPGTDFDALHPLGAAPRPPRAVRTSVAVTEDATGSHSVLNVTTTDRPGLLTAIVSVLKDVSVNVVSAEVDTEVGGVGGGWKGGARGGGAPGERRPGARRAAHTHTHTHTHTHHSQGAVAKDEFYITYHGEPLNASMTTLVVNALQYYLSQAESAIDESY